MANFDLIWPAGLGLNDPLPSSDMEDLDADHAKAVNGDEGGSYAGDLVWSGDHTFEAVLELVAGASLRLGFHTITTTDNQTLDPANGLVQRFADTPADRDHDLVAAGTAGRLMFVSCSRNGTGTAITIRRSGFAGATIVTLNNTTGGGALLYDDGTNWICLLTNGSIGTEA